MKNFNNKILFYFGLSLIILICSYIWSFISLPLNVNKSAVGVLVLKNINPFNDTIRYIVFISVPLFYYLLVNLFSKTEKTIKIKDLLVPSFNYNDNFNFKDINIISIFLIVLIFVDFFSASYKIYILDDVFHAGDQLTPAMNYYTKKGLWTSSFTVHGGYDFYFPTLAWKIFNTQSLGAYEFLDNISIIIIKILSIILVYYLIKFFNFKKKNKVLFFSIFSLFILSLSNFNYITDQLTFRDIFSLIFLIFFIQLLFKKNKFKLNFLVTLTVFLAIISNVDIGCYLFFTLFTYAIYLALSKQFKDIFQIVSVFLSLILIFIYIFGMEEFNAMLFHQINVIKNIDAVHALEYPQPFFSLGEQHASRATKALLLQLVSGFIIVSLVFNKKYKYSQNQKIFLIFLYILCLVSFKNALGRSDSYHIKACSEFQSIIIFFYILNILEKFLEKIKFMKFDKFLSPLFSSVLIFVFILNGANLKNISSFAFDAKQFVLAGDSRFLTKEYNKKISLISEIFKGEKCIQNFSTELLIPYLLKKPSCTKYFSSWLASGYETQMDYIKRLKVVAPELILYEAPGYNVDGIDTKIRLKHVNKYILENYKEYYSHEGTKIFKIRKQ